MRNFFFEGLNPSSAPLMNFGAQSPTANQSLFSQYMDPSMLGEFAPQQSSLPSIGTETDDTGLYGLANQVLGQGGLLGLLTKKDKAPTLPMTTGRMASVMGRRG